MADKVNKDKQSKLDSFVSQTPKRDQPDISPDNSSPSIQHLDKQTRLSTFGSVWINESVTSNTVSTDQVLSTAVQSGTILHLSEVVCATLKNQEFIDSIILQTSSRRKRKLNTHQNNHLYGKIGFFFLDFNTDFCHC
jgi:hypothetical protein